jgi:hypothetical protein
VSGGRGIEPEEFAEAFRRLSEWAHCGEGGERSPFKSRLTEHFGEDPGAVQRLNPEGDWDEVEWDEE